MFGLSFLFFVIGGCLLEKISSLLDIFPLMKFTNLTAQSEMRAEMDRFSGERKELMEQIQEVESQLEWLRSERDDEITRLTAEKRALQDRLHDTESQLSQLKSRKRDELKVCSSFSELAPVIIFH